MSTLKSTISAIKYKGYTGYVSYPNVVKNLWIVRNFSDKELYQITCSTKEVFIFAFGKTLDELKFNYDKAVDDFLSNKKLEYFGSQEKENIQLYGWHTKLPCFSLAQELQD